MQWFDSVECASYSVIDKTCITLLIMNQMWICFLIDIFFNLYLFHLELLGVNFPGFPSPVGYVIPPVPYNAMNYGSNGVGGKHPSNKVSNIIVVHWYFLAEFEVYVVVNAKRRLFYYWSYLCKYIHCWHRTIQLFNRDTNHFCIFMHYIKDSNFSSVKEITFNIFCGCKGC